MGLLPVWTGFAGHLFRNRVNSRINDLRAYTINLFHSWIVWRIRQDLSEANWDHPDRTHFGHGHKTTFTRALMVLQEKMLLACLCLSGDSFDDEGILGLTTARGRMVESNEKQGIRLNLHHAEGEILRRQAQLGFSGAYRSAFTNGISLLDPITGHPCDDKSKWIDVEALFQCPELPAFRQLAESIEGLILGLLKSKTSNELTLGQLKDNELPKLYRECFGTRAQLRKQFAGYWHKTLKLHEGETASLWNAVEKGKRPSSRELFLAALDDQTERVKIICEIAPFLGRIEQIFVALRAPELRDLDSATRRLEQLFGKLPLNAVLPKMDRARMLAALPASGVAWKRLARLFEMADQEAETLIRAILEYHKEDICSPRGAQPWLEILDGAWRCHVTSDRKVEKAKDDDLPWEHDFYAGAFQNLTLEIQQGLAP